MKNKVIIRTITLTFLMVILAFTFGACGSDPPSQEEASTPTTSQQTTAGSPQPAAIAESAGSPQATGADTAGPTQAAGTDTAGSTQAPGQEKVIKIGFCQDFYPTVYINEEGQPDGYDISVFKAIDERLPEYKFEFEGVSQESVLMGLDSGVYEVGLSGFFKNKEREEKYIYPKQNLGGNHLSLVTRKDTTDIKTFDDLAAKGLKLAPLAPSTGTYTIAKEYNNQHPDKPLDFEANEQVENASKYQWLLDGRYDAIFDITEFVGWTTDALKITDQVLVNEPFSAIPTYPLIRKDQVALAEAYDRVVSELKKEGVLTELSIKWFGSDVHKFIQ